MKTLAVLISILPQLIKLLNTIQAGIAEAETKRRVKDDISAIERAFAEKNPDHLKHIFSNGLSDKP